MDYKKIILDTNTTISAIASQEMVEVRIDNVSLEYMKMESLTSSFTNLKNNITEKISVIKSMFGLSLDTMADIPKSMVKDYLKDVSKVVKNEDLDLSRLKRSIPSLIGVKINAVKMNAELIKAVDVINDTSSLIKDYDLALAKYISNKDVRSSFRDQFKDLNKIEKAGNTLSDIISNIMDKGTHKDSIMIKDYIGNARSLVNISEDFSKLYDKLDFKRLNSFVHHSDSIVDSVKRLVDLDDDAVSTVNLRSILNGLQDLANLLTNISTVFYIIHQHFNMLRAINEELK